jgi:signal transduction histidine kinase
MRLRFFLAFFFITLITLAGVGIFVRAIAAQEVTSFLNRGGALGIEDIVTALEAEYQATGSWGNGWETLQALTQSSGEGRGRGQGPGGGVGMEIRSNLRLSDALGNLIIDPSNPTLAEPISEETLSAAIPLVVDRETVGYLVLPEGVEAASTGMEQVLLERLNRASINAALLGGGLALILAFIFASYLLRPLQSLMQAAEKMSAGDLSQRVNLHGSGEIAELGNAFNQMAESLEEAENRRKAMTADIAHELRNPLAIQRANLEALQDGVYDLAPENLEPVMEQNKLLTRLVGDLRTLALTDAGELNLQCQALNMVHLVSKVLERFQDFASTRQLSIQNDLPEHCPPVEADPQRMEQVLVNIIENAIRHTPEGGTIYLEVSCSEQAIAISIRDTGPGIPEAALPHIFERFYRVDRSRSREQGGSGLGLAIARNLVENHAGSLTAENHPDGGAVFNIRLPLTQST